MICIRILKASQERKASVTQKRFQTALSERYADLLKQLMRGKWIISGVALSIVLTLFPIHLAYSLLARFTAASDRTPSNWKRFSTMRRTKPLGIMNSRQNQ